MELGAKNQLKYPGGGGGGIGKRPNAQCPTKANARFPCLPFYMNMKNFRRRTSLEEEEEVSAECGVAI
jgi:hypothetical protein